jgi:hypothetical protein
VNLDDAEGGSKFCCESDAEERRRLFFTKPTNSRLTFFLLDSLSTPGPSAIPAWQAPSQRTALSTRPSGGEMAQVLSLCDCTTHDLANIFFVSDNCFRHRRVLGPIVSSSSDSIRTASHLRFEGFTATTQPG